MLRVRSENILQDCLVAQCSLNSTHVFLASSCGSPSLHMAASCEPLNPVRKCTWVADSKISFLRPGLDTTWYEGGTAVVRSPCVSGLSGGSVACARRDFTAWQLDSCKAP